MGFNKLIFGNSKSFNSTMELVDKYASFSWPVLLIGETGVGKELIARRIHERSGRSRFVAHNCSALPKTLFESELFGYEKGAFSGATQNYCGLIRQAHGGSLFLDEIGEMEIDLQVKILRFLDNNEIRPLGVGTSIKVDTRIIAATNRDLNICIKENSFRYDLYERLSVLTIKIPPLRERKEDIPILVNYFLNELGCKIDLDALNKIIDFDWPGNVRQLKNALIRASVIDGKKISSSTLEFVINGLSLQNNNNDSIIDLLAFGTLAQIEKQVITDRLKKYNGNKKATAQALGIAKSTLHEKLRRWVMDSTLMDRYCVGS